MTIKNMKGGALCVLVCDTCEKETENYMEFSDTLENAKAEGWIVKKIGKDWVHGCPNCGVD